MQFDRAIFLVPYLFLTDQPSWDDGVLELDTALTWIPSRGCMFACEIQIDTGRR